MFSGDNYDDFKRPTMRPISKRVSNISIPKIEVLEVDDSEKSEMNVDNGITQSFFKKR